MPKLGFRHACASRTLFSLIAVAGCLSAPGSSVALAQSATLTDGHYAKKTWRSVAYETGLASTYGEGDGFEGNLTACGQVFHTRVVQVAHKTLPCGTLIRIEDSETGHTIDAEVTDRGPYIAGRIVDLSWGAFRQLEPSAPGLLHVTLYLLDT
jgi:rare lipoprotein A (peptidoglycan hydrolase)